MGRKLMRVALDFNWPLDVTWKGYLNPYWEQRAECRACAGSGYAPKAKFFSDQWYGNAPFNPKEYGATPLTVDHPQIQEFAKRNIASAPDYYGKGEAAIAKEARRLFRLFENEWCHHLIQADVDALIAKGRLMEFTRRPRTEEQAEALRNAGGHWMKESNGYTPTADEVNAWSIGGFGHDCINKSICVRARCEREGFPVECPECDGDGDAFPNAEIKRLHDEWKEEEPPAGDGYQLWQTTSEGSPITPVFATLDELCVYAARYCTTFGSSRASFAEWKQMLSDGLVCHKQGNAIFI